MYKIMNYQENIIKRVKNELKMKETIQKQLAKKIGITDVHMSRLMNKTRKVSLNRAIMIANYFKISLDDLIGRKVKGAKNG